MSPNNSSPPPPPPKTQLWMDPWSLLLLDKGLCRQVASLEPECSFGWKPDDLNQLSEENPGSWFSKKNENVQQTSRTTKIFNKIMRLKKKKEDKIFP